MSDTETYGPFPEPTDEQLLDPERLATVRHMGEAMLTRQEETLRSLGENPADKLVGVDTAPYLNEDHTEAVTDEPPTLSDRAQKILNNLRRRTREREANRTRAEERRSLGTNRNAMVRQFGSLTTIQRFSRKTKY